MNRDFGQTGWSRQTLPVIFRGAKKQRYVTINIVDCFAWKGVNILGTPWILKFWSMLNGIESAKLKVKRAAEHIETLQSRAREYASDDTNFVVEESDGAKKLRFPNEPPAEIAVLAGEIVYQLRSALDHLTFELVKANPKGVTLPPNWPNRCQFPLCIEIPRKGNPPVPISVPLPFNYFKESLPGITVQAFTFIEALQPYNQGNGPMQLGWLEQLANIDKHRHFHIVNPQAYQFEHIRSPRIDSYDLSPLHDGTEIKPTLHSTDELSDAVSVERGIVDPFISFDESALPVEVTDVPVDNVLQLCMDTITTLVIPGMDKLIQNP
jgi:hypothetical protein